MNLKTVIAINAAVCGAGAVALTFLNYQINKNAVDITVLQQKIAAAQQIPATFNFQN